MIHIFRHTKASFAHNRSRSFHWQNRLSRPGGSTTAAPIAIAEDMPNEDPPEFQSVENVTFYESFQPQSSHLVTKAHLGIMRQIE